MQEWLDVETHCICAFDHSMGLSRGISILVAYYTCFPWKLTPCLQCLTVAWLLCV